MNTDRLVRNYSEIPAELNDLSGKIIGLGIDIHKDLGPGLLESSYRECLAYKIGKAGLSVQKEVRLPLIYDEVKLDVGYRIDLLIENKLIIEIKAVESLADSHTAQLLTYMKLAKIRVGLLINFNVTLLKNGIKRLVL